MGQVTILGYHISIIRAPKIPKSIVPKSIKKKQDFRCRTIKHTPTELRAIAQSMGYEWSGGL